MPNPTPLIIISIAIFILGLYVYSSGQLDGFVNADQEPQPHMTETCPTLLIKQGSAILLYDPKQSQSEKNPMTFQSLDEYTAHLDEQRKRGTQCPVLFLQQENDTQGNDVYRIRPSPTDLEPGGSYSTGPAFSQINPINTIADQQKNPLPIVDSDRVDKPYNEGNYAGFDPMGLFIGKYTELDKAHDSTANQKTSPNPSDANWGGVQYTQGLVDKGVYNDNNVYPPHLLEAKYAALQAHIIPA